MANAPAPGRQRLQARREAPSGVSSTPRVPRDRYPASALCAFYLLCLPCSEQSSAVPTLNSCRVGIAL